MPRLLLAKPKSRPSIKTRVHKDVLQSPKSQKSVRALLSDLEDGDNRHPYFHFAAQSLSAGHIMLAIRDCCHPFKFGARVSSSGEYIKFDHVALRSLRIPATTSTKVFVEDTREGYRSGRFDLRFRSQGLFNLMSWLVEKVKDNGKQVIKSQRKNLRRAKVAAKEEVSPVRQRLAVQVLIRNAERVEEELQQRSIGLD